MFNRIAIAMGDGHCKMWDISKSHLQFIIMNDLYEKGQIKFTSISWHPVKEFLLAFGTGDGQVISNFYYSFIYFTLVNS